MSFLLLLLFFLLRLPPQATHLWIHGRVRFSRPQGLDSRIPWQAWRTDRTDARGTTCPRTVGRLSCPEPQRMMSGGGRVKGRGEEEIRAVVREWRGVAGARSIKWMIHVSRCISRHPWTPPRPPVAFARTSAQPTSPKKHTLVKLKKLGRGQLLYITRIALRKIVRPGV